MNKFALTLGALAVAVAATGCSRDALLTQTAPADCRNGMLADWHGHKTLYTLDKDGKDQSSCNEYCATVWPPLRATAGDKPVAGFTTFKRADGTYQWAYNGKPVYTFAKDSNTGDKTGDAVSGPYGTWTALKCPM